jgi:hypothetical protein
VGTLSLTVADASASGTLVFLYKKIGIFQECFKIKMRLRFAAADALAL